MLGSDLLFGFILGKLLTRDKQPAVTFSAPGSAPPAAPSPAAAPAAPRAVTPATFPQAVTVPPVQPASSPAPTPAGFKRAVEVWIVKPEIARQAGVVVGQMGAEVGAMTVAVLKQQFPNGWRGAPSATAAEAEMAKRLLPQWKDGMVVFAHQPAGAPETAQNIRAFRMTKHPLNSGVTAPARPAPTRPAAAPAAPTVPASFPAPAAAPAAPAAPAPAPVETLPEVVIRADQPAAPVALVTAVRRGEGLANVAKRLGRPATMASVKELHAANVPQGPDAQWSVAKDGNLKKAGRAGGLQPGDRLFVPAAWGPIDAARL